MDAKGKKRNKYANRPVGALTFRKLASFFQADQDAGKIEEIDAALKALGE